MTQETVSIPKDEYIELLRCRSLLMEQELASLEQRSLPPRKPHSWMNQAEKDEILRLASLGLRRGEIGQQIGRPASTVSRWMKRHGFPAQRNRVHQTGSAAGFEPCIHQRPEGT